MLTLKARHIATNSSDLDQISVCRMLGDNSTLSQSVDALYYIYESIDVTSSSVAVAACKIYIKQLSNDRTQIQGHLSSKLPKQQYDFFFSDVHINYLEYIQLIT